jgi:hypothetical protein
MIASFGTVSYLIKLAPGKRIMPAEAPCQATWPYRNILKEFIKNKKIRTNKNKSAYVQNSGVNPIKSQFIY